MLGLLQQPKKCLWTEQCGFGDILGEQSLMELHMGMSV